MAPGGRQRRDAALAVLLGVLVAATLNVIGPGLGQVGASESYEIVDPLGRFVLMVCMLLGRLELFTALALLSTAFWKRQGPRLT